jgi:hypothetical protein
MLAPNPSQHLESENPARGNPLYRFSLPESCSNARRWSREDVLQDSMARALTYFGSFKGINPHRWLPQIVRNVAYDSIKIRHQK